MFEFYIDGTKYADPINWRDFTETIEYSDTQYLIGFKYEQKLNFNGSAYDYLYQKKRLEGFCYEAEIVIKQKCTPNALFKTIFTGKIFLSDCTFHLGRCVVECSIEDNNYGSLVFNNKGIKVFLEVPAKSKNGEVISFTDALGHPTINKAWSAFDYLNSPLALGTGVLSVHVYDAFKFIIAWITDNQVDFKSDLLDYSLPVTSEMDKVKYLSIISGQELRIGYTGINYDKQYMYVSFDQLFSQVNKYYPLGISIEYTTAGKPVIRIEEFSNLRQSANSIQINNIEQIDEHINTQFLYNRMKIGGPSAEYNPSIHTYPPTKELTFQQEEYYLTGQCNIDKEKDLTLDFICDTNIIEELVETNRTNQNYDSDIFFIEVDTLSSVLVSTRMTANYDDPTKFHFNDNLLNIKAAIRNPLGTNLDNNTGFGLDIANSSDGTDITSLGVQSDIALGSMPPPQVSGFHNVVFAIDNAAVFDGTKYTALISGAYSFWVEQNVRAQSLVNRIYWVKVELRRYNSGAVLQETDTRNYGPFTANGFQGLPAPYVPFTLATGDYMTCFIQYSSQPVNYAIPSSIEVLCSYTSLNQSDFRTGSVPNSAGVVMNNSPLAYSANILNFDYPLDQNNYELFKADPRKSILFNMGDNINRKGWVRKSIRNMATGETKWELISNVNNSN